ncbi:hypothetical protein [Streptomyces coeruleorubidus]|uniref:hypothetical protein n=1 Tax=Streptomyces coeruleorubidus TaxID=116188 RepID=UPI0033A3B43E
MSKRKRSSARAAAAAVSLITVTAICAGQAHGTSNGGATHNEAATGVKGSPNLHWALAQAPREAAGGSAETGPPPAPDGHEPKPPHGHKPKPPAAARAALAKLQARITNYIAQNPGATYTFGGYLDEATGRIVLGTDAPESVLSQLTDFSGEPESEVQAIRNMLVSRSTFDLQSRRDDAPPFSGGGGTRSESGFGCTSGYAVQTSGIRLMVTAGHCATDGTPITTQTGSHRYYGLVQDQRVDLDTELISGEFYQGRIFTGGVDSNTTIPVFGAVDAEALTYDDYCLSGASTGESCGHTVRSNLGFGCTGFFEGCLTGLTAYTGGRPPQDGDSGAPFYSKISGGAFIHGHHSGSLDFRNVGLGIVSLAVPWTKVSDAFGVDIVAENE